MWSNNLRQLSLAVHNYASANQHFPSLSHPDVNSNYSGGYSYWIELLPYIERNNLFDQLDRSAHPWLANVSAAANKRLINGTVLNEFTCPSSDLPQLANVERHTPGREMPGDAESTRPQYVALSGGAHDDPGVPQPRFDEPEFEVCCSCCDGNAENGLFSPNGILAPAGETSKLASVTDGLSNTALFGEISAFFYEPSGEPLQAYGRSGIVMGSAGKTHRVGLRYFHATTVRYQHNTDSLGLPGVHPNFGPNMPLISYHPGGVHVAMGDGAVRFETDDAEIIVLKQLATKDDSNVVNSGG